MGPAFAARGGVAEPGGYDPFAPGPSVVETRTMDAIDPSRDRALTIEVWSPTGAMRPPLVAFSHTSGGHRRQASLLCAHLASHGYVVAAVDHAGNTADDYADRIARGVTLTTEEVDAYVRRIVADRVPDLRFTADTVSSALETDPERLGLLGWSFGGWAVLATLEADDRFGAVVAMAPAGSSQPLPGIIPVTLTFDWRRVVPALYLAGELDPFTPLPGILEIFDRSRSPKRLVVLAGAGHGHFGDEIAGTEPCPREHALLFTRGLVLAHLDASLRGDPRARAFMQADIIATLRSRGVAASEPRRAMPLQPG